MKDTVRVFVSDDESSVERVWQASRIRGRHRHPDALGDRSTDASRLWAWDGVIWHSFDTPGPELRRHIKLAYDTARGRLALYGGYDDVGREMYSERHHLGRDLREAFARHWPCATS